MMNSTNLNSLGPIRAAELALSARNESARRHAEATTVTMEIARPAATAALPTTRADTTLPSLATERVLVDIAV